MSVGQQRKKKRREVSLVRRNWWLAPVLIFVAMLAWIATGPEWTGPRVGRVGERKDIAAGALPVSREVEPNNLFSLANLIALAKPVTGEIAAAVDDVDTFTVTTPPAPRDLISIEVQAVSRTLSPEMKVFDPEGRLLAWVKGNPEPGHAVSTTIAPPPKTPLFIQVMGLGSSAGVYTLLVTPLRKFDAYEPNDEIFNAHKIAIGEVVNAGIMDESDTDYYSFETPREGKAVVTIVNRSATLIPALTTFTPGQRSSGFGPDVRTPGGDLKHSFNVEGLKTYFIQVWSQANTAGDYRLTVAIE